MHVKAHRLGEKYGDLPVAVAVARRHYLAHKLDAPFRVGEGAVLLQEGGAGQEHVGIVRGLVQEQILHDDALHRREPGGDVMRVGVGLQNVLALDVDALEGAADRGVEHVGNAQSRLAVELHAPERFEHLAHGVGRDVTVAGELVRERAHVARALHVVLAAQRINADALAPDVAGGHGEIGDRHDRRGTLTVLGDTKPVVDRTVAAGGVKPRRRANGLRRHA
jgi:hypothetical protein